MRMQTTTLDVTGMSCGHCVGHVGDALRAVPGVSSAEVSLDAATAVVQHDASAAPTSALIDAVAEAGYEARPRS